MLLLFCTIAAACEGASGNNQKVAGSEVLQCGGLLRHVCQVAALQLPAALARLLAAEAGLVLVREREKQSPSDVSSFGAHVSMQ